MAKECWVGFLILEGSSLGKVGGGLRELECEAEVSKDDNLFKTKRPQN